MDSDPLGIMASELLALLDRIELEDDPTLASQRHVIAEKHGFDVVFTPIDSAETH